jgi:hypothetical protein
VEDACDKQGRGKDRTVDVNRRRCRQRRDDPIVDVMGERRRNNLTAIVGPHTRQAGARRGRDRGRRQEEAPAEEGQPDHGRRGGAAVQ